jgi:hypothetical protein
MQAKWGMAWLVTACLLVSAFCTPLPGLAAGVYSWNTSPSSRPPIFLVGTQSSMEAQLLEEKPGPSRVPGALLPSLAPSLQVNQDGAATLRFSHNLEMKISFLYNRDPSSPDTLQLRESPLFMKYSMDYRVLPNLRVGLNSYLYRPAEEGPAFPHAFGKQVMGFGPALKYDLGRWSFLLKSQVESGNRDQGEGLQNWFRIWYAF